MALSPLSQLQDVAIDEATQLQAPQDTQGGYDATLDQTQPVAKSKEDTLLNQRLSEHEKTKLQLDQQIKKITDSYGERSNNLPFDPKLMALAQGFLTPGKTGSFLESAGLGFGNYATAANEEQKQLRDNAKARIEMMKEGLSINEKNLVMQLAPKLFKTDAEGKYTGEIDPIIANKLVSVSGDTGIIQKIIDLNKPKIGHAPAGSSIYDERTGKIISTVPKEISPSDLKKKSEELAVLKAKLKLDPNNQELKTQIKYYEDDFKKLDQLEFTPEILDMMARQALAGDTSVFYNVGRGNQGPNNIVRLRIKMNEIMKANGLSPEDIAMKNAEFFGIKAGERTLGTRGANIELAAQEFLNIVPMAKQASDKVNRVGLLPFGKLQVLFDENVNDPDLSAFAAYNNGIINTYARAISPTGVPTVSDKVHARKIISEAKNKPAYDAAINALAQEIEAARASPAQVRTNMRKEITGNTPPSTPTNKPSDKPASGKHYLNNREIVVKGNKWVFADTGEEAK